MIVTLPAQAPTIEVASVKKLDQPVAGLAGFGPSIRGNTMRMTNATLASLIHFGYGLRDFQVIGGPDWLSKDMFELQAKAAGEPSEPEMKLMLRSLLEDRFGLVMHNEQRDTRFFAMVPARSDGRLGPYLHRGPDTPTQPCDRKQIEELESGRRKPTPGMAMSMASISCGSLANLADIASRLVDLPVFDRTGLTGRWSATLYFLPAPGTTRPDVAPDPSLASFTTALQEQLGLRLEATRGPVDVMVIDAVERPTPD
jgi:uncharacterized protein (TIGR03435 family)